MLIENGRISGWSQTLKLYDILEYYTWFSITNVFSLKFLSIFQNIVLEKSDSDLFYNCRLCRGILCFLGQYFYDVFSGNIGLISCSIYLCYFCRYIGLISPLPRAQLCWWFSTRKLPYRDQRRRQCTHEMVFSIPYFMILHFFLELMKAPAAKGYKRITGTPKLPSRVTFIQGIVCQQSASS